MKLFSFKSLCLRWRGELIDNANVPVGLGEEEGGEMGEKWRGGNLAQVFDSHFKYHIERISMYISYKSFISMSVREFLWICFGKMNICRRYMLDTSAHIHVHRHAHLCYWQGQSEWSVSRSPKAQGSYRLQLWCVCALATPQCVSACVLQGG